MEKASVKRRWVLSLVESPLCITGHVQWIRLTLPISICCSRTQPTTRIWSDRLVRMSLTSLACATWWEGVGASFCKATTSCKLSELSTSAGTSLPLTPLASSKMKSVFKTNRTSENLDCHVNSCSQSHSFHLSVGSNLSSMHLPIERSMKWTLANQ